MYFLYVSRSHKKILVHFLRVFPPENGWLTWPMVLFVVFTEIEDSILNFCKAHLLVCNHLINRSEDFGSGESLQKLRIESSISVNILFTVQQQVSAFWCKRSVWESSGVNFNIVLLLLFALTLFSRAPSSDKMNFLSESFTMRGWRSCKPNQTCVEDDLEKRNEGLCYHYGK